MADALAEKLKTTALKYALQPYAGRILQQPLTHSRDGQADDDWKKNLKIPAKDTRVQTEVGTYLIFTSNIYSDYFYRIFSLTA